MLADSMAHPLGQTAQEGAEVGRRAAILCPLAEAPTCSRADARAAASALGVSERHIYALLRRLRQAGGDTTALRLNKSRGGRGQSRLPPAAENALHDLIEASRREMPGKPAGFIVQDVLRRGRQQSLPLPSSSTILRRLKAPMPNGQLPNGGSSPHQPSAKQDLVGTRSAHPPPGADPDAVLLELLYETVGQADGWAVFLEALAQRYAGGKGLMVVHDVVLRTGYLPVGSGWDPKTYPAYSQHYITSNPWIPNQGKRPTGLVVPAEAMAPRDELIKTEFYQDLLRPVKIDSGIGVTVQRDGRRHMMINVLFPHSTAERDPDSIGRLQRLVPHLLRVAQLNRQFAGLETRAEVAEFALDRLATALFIVDGGAHILHLNASAERTVAASDGLTVIRKGLEPFDPGEGRGLRHLIADALRAPREIGVLPGGAMRIRRPSGRAPYEVLVAPLSEITIGLNFSGPLAVVFVRDPEARIMTPLERLQRLYALTRSEARLMQALLAGDTLDMSAERFGVTKETLRSQLKAVFLKTDTASQIELIRLGLRGLAAFQY
jgi:DNA-binding CsgD family transcriptional regulator